MNEEQSEIRILIVEDSPVIAIDTEEMVRSMGYHAVGPLGNMADALVAAEAEQINAAIVDLNIRGAKPFPILQKLERRGIPFLIVSGYADWRMPDEWSDRPRLAKPYSKAQLEKALSALLA